MIPRSQIKTPGNNTNLIAKREDEYMGVLAMVGIKKDLSPRVP